MMNADILARRRACSAPVAIDPALLKIALAYSGGVPPPPPGADHTSTPQASVYPNTLVSITDERNCSLPPTPGVDSPSRSTSGHGTDSEPTSANFLSSPTSAPSSAYSSVPRRPPRTSPLKGPAITLTDEWPESEPDSRARQSSFCESDPGAIAIEDLPKSIVDNYTMLQTLGEGGFAVVKLALHKLSRERVAIKIVSKTDMSSLERTYLEREMQAWKILNHPNIVHLYEIAESTHYACFVMEYCPGGELFDRIVVCKRLSETEARRYFRQVVEAVQHCHQMGYAHRDIKPENLLLDSNGNVKLIDFGLVGEITSTQDTLAASIRLRTQCGSDCYAAPEIVSGLSYDGVLADIWSLGIVLYAMLCGFLPFEHPDPKVLYARINEGRYPIPRWLTPGAEHLIAMCLRHDPAQRAPLSSLLSEPWVSKAMPASVANLCHAIAQGTSSTPSSAPHSPTALSSSHPHASLLTAPTTTTASATTTTSSGGPTPSTLSPSTTITSPTFPQQLQQQQQQQQQQQPQQQQQQQQQQPQQVSVGLGSSPLSQITRRASQTQLARPLSPLSATTTSSTTTTTTTTTTITTTTSITSAPTHTHSRSTTPRPSSPLARPPTPHALMPTTSGSSDSLLGPASCSSDSSTSPPISPVEKQSAGSSDSLDRAILEQISQTRGISLHTAQAQRTSFGSVHADFVLLRKASRATCSDDTSDSAVSRLPSESASSSVSQISESSLSSEVAAAATRIAAVAKLQHGRRGADAAGPAGSVRSPSRGGAGRAASLSLSFDASRSMQDLHVAGAAGVSPQTGTPAASGAAAAHEDMHSSTPQRSLRHGLQQIKRILFGTRASSGTEPRVVKGVFNVATTSSRPPIEIKAMVEAALVARQADVTSNGFRLRAVLPCEEEEDRKGVTLEIEVCSVRGVGVTGLKFRRIKGDTWAYNKECQALLEVLRL